EFRKSEEGTVPSPLVTELSSVRVRIRQDDRLLRTRDWKRAEKHGVKHSENRHVCADAKRQRYHGDGSEARILSQHPKSVTKVLKQCAHSLHLRVLLAPQRDHRIHLGRAAGREQPGGRRRSE